MPLALLDHRALAQDLSAVGLTKAVALAQSRCAGAEPWRWPSLYHNGDSAVVQVLGRKPR